MVQFCAVFGCSNRSNRDSFSFYRFPIPNQRLKEEANKQTKTRCKRWVSAIRRSDLTDEKLKNARVCSAHFISGKPASLDDINNCDWLPCLNLGHSGSSKDLTKSVSRYNRAHARLYKDVPCKLVQTTHQEDEVLFEPGLKDATVTTPAVGDESTVTTPAVGDNEVGDNENTATTSTVNEHTATVGCQTDIRLESVECQTDIRLESVECQTDIRLESVECQTDMTTDTIVEHETELHHAQQVIAAQNSELLRANDEIYKLREVVGSLTMNEDDMRKDTKKTLFYTGIPNIELFFVIVETMSPFLNVTASSVLSKFQQVLLFLMKLRLNLKFRDLAHRFNIGETTASRTFHNCLDVFHERFSYTVRWPDRDELYRTMPHAFTKAFGKNVAIIIDCFEIFIETPSNLMAKCQTWSTYKHHNTLKFLIGICPQGAITYISEAWGGRVSDKHITEECGILKHLLPGDIVMADRGFSIDDAVGFHFAQVKIPAFTKGKKQLSPLDVEQTRKIASLRIHVERVIGLTRNKYNILNGPLQREMLVDNGNGSTINKIVRSACALTTMCQSVVPID